MKMKFQGKDPATKLPLKSQSKIYSFFFGDDESNVDQSEKGDKNKENPVYSEISESRFQETPREKEQTDYNRENMETAKSKSNRVVPERVELAMTPRSGSKQKPVKLIN